MHDYMYLVLSLEITNLSLNINVHKAIIVQTKWDL